MPKSFLELPKAYLMGGPAGYIKKAGEQLVGGAKATGEGLLDVGFAALPGGEESVTGQLAREARANIERSGGFDQAMALAALAGLRGAPSALARTPKAVLPAVPAEIGPVEASVIANEVLGKPARLAARKGGRQLTQAEWEAQDPLLARKPPEVDRIRLSRESQAAPKHPLEQLGAKLAEQEAVKAKLASENVRQAQEFQASRFAPGETTELSQRIAEANKANPRLKQFAEEKGVTFDYGFDYGKGTQLHFTDPQNGSTFTVPAKNFTEASFNKKFRAHRRRYEEAAAEEVRSVGQEKGQEGVQVGPPKAELPSAKALEAMIAEKFDKIYRRNLEAQGMKPPPSSASLSEAERILNAKSKKD